jgi:hypothetical protein
VLDGIENDLAIALVAKDHNGGVSGYLANFVDQMQAIGAAKTASATRPQVEQHNITPFAKVRNLMDLGLTAGPSNEFRPQGPRQGHSEL